MSIDEVILTRRSIRRYQSRDVPEPLLRDLLALSLHAPSSMDGQPWCFIVIRNGLTKQRLAEIKNAHCPPEKRDYPADFLADAPVIVAVCVEKNRSHHREHENGILAAYQLILAAWERGLGSVYLSAYRSDDPGLARAIASLLQLPAEVMPVSLIPLGFPAEPAPPKQVRDLSEMIHNEVYGGSR
jgi:nitroreductase